MADVHKGHDSTGIKLFGKMINVQDMVSKSDETLMNRRPEKIIACPRCKSMETKFCYFNNYNVNQPRHFCKGCQRYWTAGGALRNVPVGAGRRKAKLSCGHGVFLGDRHSDVSVWHDSTSGSSIHFDGMVEWQIAADGGFQHLFPAKRRRIPPGDL